MERQRRNELLREGWRQIPTSQRWINDKGELLTPDTNKITTPRNVITPHGRIKIAKAVLWLFGGVTPRSGQITHLNGDKEDNSLNNIKYSALFNRSERETIDRDNLRTAIRCYFNIDRKAKPDLCDGITRTHIGLLAELRSYVERKANEPFISIFGEWLGDGITLSLNTTEIARKHAMAVRDIRLIVARYLNALTSEVCDDLDEGELSLQPYLETASERRQRITKILHNRGLKRPSPPRYPADIEREMLRLTIEPPSPITAEQRRRTPLTKLIREWLTLAEWGVITRKIATTGETEPLDQLLRQIRERRASLGVCQALRQSPLDR